MPGTTAPPPCILYWIFTFKQSSGLKDTSLEYKHKLQIFTSRQENYHPGISKADASSRCTVLGGDHNKDFSPVYVVGQPSLFLFLPDTLVQIMRIII